MQRYRYIWHLQIQIQIQIQLELVLLTCGTFVGHESRKAALAEAIEYRVERLATCLYLGRILGLSAAGGQREQQRAQQRQQQQQLLLLSILEHCNRLGRERDVCVPVEDVCCVRLVAAQDVLLSVAVASSFISRLLRLLLTCHL